MLLVGIAKENNDFHLKKNPKGIYVLYSYCKICKAMQDKEYRERNPEKCKAKRQRYYQEHKDDILRKTKEYIKLHRTEVGARKKRYYRSHKEQYAASINKRRQIATTYVNAIKESTPCTDCRQVFRCYGYGF